MEVPQGKPELGPVHRGERDRRKRQATSDWQVAVLITKESLHMRLVFTKQILTSTHQKHKSLYRGLTWAQSHACSVEGLSKSWLSHSCVLQVARNLRRVGRRYTSRTGKEVIHSLWWLELSSEVNQQSCPLTTSSRMAGSSDWGTHTELSGVSYFWSNFSDSHKVVAMVFSSQLHYSIIVCYSKNISFIFLMVQWTLKTLWVFLFDYCVHVIYLETWMRKRKMIIMKIV